MKSEGLASLTGSVGTSDDWANAVWLVFMLLSVGLLFLPDEKR